MNIGFIGIGNMGTAIARAISHRPGGKTFFLSTHNPKRASEVSDYLQKEWSLNIELASNEEIASKCEVIFLGVKPHLVTDLLDELAPILTQREGALWISMAAGVTLQKLRQHLPAQHRLIRMMPNTPISVGRGMTTYVMEEENKADEDIFEELLGYSGSFMKMAEKDIDSASGIAGCGPAFVFQFIEAMVDAGVKNGLKREDALFLAAQTVYGSAAMLLETPMHPAQLRDAVTSPGGSTIAGVVALEKNGFRYATIDAIDQAIQRTKELG